MTSTSILYLLIGILSFNFAMGLLQEFLDLKNMKPELPEKLKGIYDEEKYKKSQEYTHTKTRFGFVTSVFGFVLTLVVLLSGALGWVDGFVQQYTADPIFVALAFFGLLYIVNDLLSLPFSIYNTFVIEEKFGFNKTTVKTFILDKIKGYVLGAILGGGILALLILLIDTLQVDFWLWFWLAIGIVMVLMNFLYATVFLPLFNKLVPLESGSLRTAIESYSEKVDFPLTNVLVMDGSKRSAKSNAFFTGFGKSKRIVLFDTLIENHSEEELVAVLAHEVGHYKKKHVLFSFAISIAQMGLTLFILSKMIFSEALTASLGGTGLSYHLNLLAFGFLYSPISQLLGLAMTMLSRKNEYEADEFAASTYGAKPLSDALIKLHMDNLANLTPHPFVVFMNYSHPTLLQRLSALEK